MTEKTQEGFAQPQHNHHHQPLPQDAQHGHGNQGFPPQYPAQYPQNQGQGYGGVGMVGGTGGMGGMNEGQVYQQHLMGQCARGNHSYDTKYGVVGIIVAVCCFPCGLFALCCDKKEICTRCGHQTL